MKKRSLTLMTLLTVMLVCIAVATLVAPVEVAAASIEIPVEGKRFEAEDQYVFPSISSDIVTLEAEIWIDAKSTDEASFGAILSNRSAASDGSCMIAWEITDGGRLCYYNSTVGSTTFNLDLRTFISGDDFVKVAIAVDTDSEAHRILLYVNGILREVKTENDNGDALSITCLAPAFNPTSNEISGNPLRLAGDYSDGNNSYFKGILKNITLYSDLRTASEIKGSITESEYSVDSTDTALVAAFDTTGYVGKDLSANGNNLTFSTTAGISFTQKGDKLQIKKGFTEVPRTYEAWVYVPDSVTGGGYIFCNYGNTADGHGTNRLGFGVMGEEPRLYYTQTNKKDASTTSTFSNVSAKLNGWVHLAMVHDGETLYCYINGVLVDSLPQSYDILSTVTVNNPLVLGGDWRNNNTQYFRGKVKDVAVYSTVKTAEQVMDTYRYGVNLEEEGILMYLECDGENPDFIEDKTGNGYDAVRGPAEVIETWITESSVNPDDYAYTFVVVGDTQKLCYKDYQNATDDDPDNDSAYMASIYDWIVNNKEEQKIEFVFGVGDITDKDNDGEWEIAHNNITKLSDAGIPYSLVYGLGHDTVAQLDKYFSNESNFTGADIGYYSGNSLCNYYMRFTVGATKYLVFGLDYGPTNAVLSWAGDIIEANPDYKVIITTHGYLAGDGGYLTSDCGDAVPRDTNDNNGKNNGDEIWTKLASQYENVLFVFCGHYCTEDIVWRQDIGIHGNTVSQFLIDPQNFDAYGTYKYKTGMVALFHVSEDGKSVAVEWYSTIQDKYYLKKNQFTVTIPDKVTLADVETEYGSIPGMYSNEQTYPFVVFKTDKTFVGGYGDFGAAANATVANDPYADYVILMRRNAEQNQSTSLSGFYGSITVDLGGKRLMKTGAGYLISLACTAKAGTDGENMKCGTYVFKNGHIHRTGGSALCSITYNEKLKSSVSLSFDFKDILFTSPSGTRLMFANWEDKGYDLVPDEVTISIDLRLSDCTFDYTNSATGITMLQLTHDGRDRIIVNTTLEGGRIIANESITLSQFAQMDDDTNGRADSVILNPNEEGEYLTMLLPDGVTAPTVENVWINGDGKSLVFTKATKDGEQISYSAVPLLLNGFVVKNSITLWINYEYNIYIPVKNVKSFAIDGEVIDVNKLNIVEIDGVDYYLNKVALYSTDMLCDISLDLTVGNDNEEITVECIFNVFNYARTIIEGEYSEVEKQLLSDMLSYARAAYTYTNTGSAHIDEINWLIGYSYDEENKPSVSGNALCPVGNVGIESACLNLGNEIAFRFYLSNGYSKDDLKFTVDAIDAEVTEGTDENGKRYLELKLYAYQLCDDITFSVTQNGEIISESYNIYAYYEYVTVKYADDINLINFVERLIKYSESAEAFRLNFTE